jgi:uncharacterized protein YdbL (DUF1318 family)
MGACLEVLMKRSIRVAGLLVLLAAVSCVTINIYFPAEEVRSAADRIVNEVWGERARPEEPKPPLLEKPPGNSMFFLLQPRSAYAQQDIDVSTPEIRAIRTSLKERSGKLFPYFDAGNVGVGRDGLLKVRTTEGLDLKGRAEVQQLVSAENADRRRLYKEIARANGFPDKADEVQQIFADTWRDKAGKGWYIEQSGGGWERK